MSLSRTRPSLPPARRGLARAVALLGTAGTLAAASLLAPAVAPPRTVPAPALSDAAFWELFTSASEPGGQFLSDNYVSNEMGYQEVIPALQRTLAKGGVYLGVGPEQNFTYIANLQPRLAVIFDIRRQNAMQLLMYKALFELSPTRAGFLSRLFARRVPELGDRATARELFDSAAAADASDAAARANFADIARTLTRGHHFALADSDVAVIDYVYRAFVEAGPDVNYGFRRGMGGHAHSPYPSFAELQQATNADSVPMAFLATEERYRTVRRMQQRNLIVPVVGDFAGPHAIRAVGEYLRRHDLVVSAFYVSNVEQYLFRDGDAAARFYGNVALLPLDSTAAFIRSVPGFFAYARAGTTAPASSQDRRLQLPLGALSIAPYITITIRDSSGLRTTRVVQDSAGLPVIRVMTDSAGGPVLRVTTDSGTSLPPLITAPRDSGAMRLTRLSAAPALVASRITSGMLESGIASIRATLEAFQAGRLTSYQDVIAMTATGWSPER